MYGHTAGREHHLMNPLEAKLFYILDLAPNVVDIREQMDLDLEYTLQIATELGLNNDLARDSKTNQIIPLYTTFIVDLADGSVKAIRVAKSEKLVGKLLNTCEIERIYWPAYNQQSSWGLITELDISDVVANNAKFVHPYWNLDGRIVSPDLIDLIGDYITNAMSQKEQTLNAIAKSADVDLGIEPSTSMSVAKHLIARREWIIDWNTPIGKLQSITDVRGVVNQSQRAG